MWLWLRYEILKDYGTSRDSWGYYCGFQGLGGGGGCAEIVAYLLTLILKLKQKIKNYG
jgi:hypothetical protein